MYIFYLQQSKCFVLIFFSYQIFLFTDLFENGQRPSYEEVFSQFERDHSIAIEPIGFDIERQYKIITAYKKWYASRNKRKHDTSVDECKYIYFIS